MSDNPFSEPATDDRTVIRPTPGGRRTAPPAPRRSRPRGGGAGSRPIAPPAIALSPLAAAASPLLQLLARLRDTCGNPPDAPALRDARCRDLVTFERAREAGMPMELLRPAHFALCASIDDVVLNTPWGAASGWASASHWWRPFTTAHAAPISSSISCADAAGCRQVPAGDRADVLCLARLHWAASDSAAATADWTGCGRKPTQRCIAASPSPAIGPVAALAGRRRAVSVVARQITGLGLATAAALAAMRRHSFIGHRPG